MSVYTPFDRLMSYKGPYGHADKDAIKDPLSQNRFEQSIFPFDHGLMDVMKDGASSWINSSGMMSRKVRDIMIDRQNPREELPKDQISIEQMDIIPNQANIPQIDMSHPEDYKASNAVKLYQQAAYNATQQETIFTDPQALKKNLEQGDVAPQSRSQKGLSQLEAYSFDGSAAGRQSNYLHTDQDGQYIPQVNQDSAF